MAGSTVISVKSQDKNIKSKRGFKPKKLKRGFKAGASKGTTLSNVRSLSTPTWQVQKGPSPFPNKYAVRLKWSHITGLTTGTGNLTGSIAYRVNGPYDPDVAAGGGQPLYWDQMALMYKQYRCTGALVELSFNSPGNSGPYYGGYRVRRSGDTVSSGMSYDDFKVQRWNDIGLVSTSGTQQRKYKVFIKPNVIFGHNNDQLQDDPNYQALVSTVPVNQAYIDVVCYNPSATAVAANVSITITYYFTFSGLVLTQDA